MFGIGMPELILILVIALIVLGPQKLPEIARTLGRGMQEFRKATDDLRDNLMSDRYEPPKGPEAAGAAQGETAAVPLTTPGAGPGPADASAAGAPASPAGDLEATQQSQVAEYVEQELDLGRETISADRQDPPSEPASAGPPAATPGPVSETRVFTAADADDEGRSAGDPRPPSS